MIKDNEKMDELFRSKLEGFEQDPPSYVWERIREQQAGKRRNVFFLYLKGTGVAAAVLLAFILGWQWQLDRQEEIPTLMSERQEIVAPNQQAEGQDQAAAAVEKLTAEAQVAENKQPELIERETEAKPVVPEQQVKPLVAEARNVTQQVTQDEIAREQESFSLLNLLDIELDEVFPEENQLAAINQKKITTNEALLSSVDQSRIQENARLLAANREAKQSGSWQVGAMVTPGYAISNNSQSNNYARDMAIANNNSDLNLGGGISVEYKTASKWSVQSGVYYSKLEQNSSNQPYRAENIYADAAPPSFDIQDELAYFNTAVAVRSGEMLMNTAAGVVALDNLPSNAKLSNSFESPSSQDGILLTATEFEQAFDYIEIPLIVRYQLLDAAFDIQLLGGINTSVLVANNAYARSQFGREHIGETRDMNTFNYSTSIGVGVGYGITNKISIHVEPQLKYFLGSLNDNPDVSFKPYTIGVSTGLSYHF